MSAGWNLEAWGLWFTRKDILWLVDKVIISSLLYKWVNGAEVIPESPQFKACPYLPACLGMAACKLFQIGNCFKSNLIHNIVTGIGGQWCHQIYQHNSLLRAPAVVETTALSKVSLWAKMWKKLNTNLRWLFVYKVVLCTSFGYELSHFPVQLYFSYSCYLYLFIK